MIFEFGLYVFILLFLFVLNSDGFRGGGLFIRVNNYSFNNSRILLIEFMCRYI